MTADDAHHRCAAASLTRAEPLLATASRVRRWLCIEQPGPWGPDALLDSRMDDVVAQTICSHARRAGVRVVLIRRPGWVAGDGQRVYLARTDRFHRWIERVDIEDARQLTDLDLAVLDAAEPPGIGTPGPADVHLVCTNGRHDACCADLGRPVVRALCDADVDEVWECSHIGGDRFAANIVFLPTGVYYGRVPPERAAEVVAAHADGFLDLDCYRGRSFFPPLVQAAEIFVRVEVGELRLDALRVTGATRAGPDQMTVALDHDGRRVQIRVERGRADAELLTCTAEGPVAPWRYRVLDLQV